MPPIEKSLLENNGSSPDVKDLQERIDRMSVTAGEIMQSFFPPVEVPKPGKAELRKSAIATYSTRDGKPVEAWLEEKADGSGNPHAIVLVTRIGEMHDFANRVNDGVTHAAVYEEELVRASVGIERGSKVTPTLQPAEIENITDTDFPYSPDGLIAIRNITETLELIREAQQAVKVGSATVGTTVELS